MLLPKTLLTICSVWLLCSCNFELLHKNGSAVQLGHATLIGISRKAQYLENIADHPTDALIVPQELPSLLSLVYSNIPPIKKGTDSRLGFGFRLGEHADFQVLVELGPQKETRPIGDQDGESSFNKRQISKAEKNALLRQQLRQQLQQRQELTSTEGNAATWLESWSQDMTSQQKKSSKSKSKQRDTKKQQNDKPNLIPSPPVLQSESLQQLQLLYKMATTTEKPVTTIETPKSTTENDTDADLQAMAERLKRRAQITRELMNVSMEESK